MSPPRLTGALRSFSNVSKKEDQDGQVYDLKVKCVVNDALYVSHAPFLWNNLPRHTVQAKRLDTPSHSMRFIYFHDYLHFGFSLKASKLNE